MAVTVDVATRKANWSLEEICSLVDGVVSRWNIIKGKFSPILTSQTKNKAWEEVVESVNACSKSAARDVKCIKKKWTDLQSATRKKEAERRKDAMKTGGGPAPSSLKEWEDKILTVINDGMVSGVEGGYEAQAGFQGAYESERSGKAMVGPTGDAMPSVSHQTSSFQGNEDIIVENPVDNEQNIENSPLLYESSTSESSFIKKRRTSQSCNTQDYSSRLLAIEEEKLVIKKQKLTFERRKVEALEGILEELKKREEIRSTPLSPALFSLTPTIKFT